MAFHHNQKGKWESCMDEKQRGVKICCTCIEQYFSIWETETVVQGVNIIKLHARACHFMDVKDRSIAGVQFTPSTQHDTLRQGEGGFTVINSYIYSSILVHSNTCTNNSCFSKQNGLACLHGLLIWTILCILTRIPTYIEHYFLYIWESTQFPKYHSQILLCSFQNY
jgi:hypothetical protein